MSGIVRWFVNNAVAANLLMIFLIVGGLIGVSQIGKEAFPSIKPNEIEVYVNYLGAGPEEVEERIVIRIEEAVYDLDGIERIRSRSREGFGMVWIEAEEGYDIQQLLNEVKSRVDAINTFPALSERPIVARNRWDNPVLQAAIVGDISEEELKELGRQARNDIAALPGIARAELDGTRAYEISIEISEFQLQKYGLSFQDVANAISRSSINLPAGNVRNETGNIQIMARGQAYEGKDFEDIVVLRNPDGTRVLLKDVATIIDGFEDSQFIARVNGKRAVLLKALSGENPDVLLMSESLHDYIDNTLNPRLPEGVEALIWIDNSEAFNSRVETLLNNGLSGLVLVFLGLMLFLTPSLAGWVVVGIAVSFFGAFTFMHYTGITLNMITMFSFILILGIVVDDAIIVGENVHRENQRGILGTKGAALGASRVVKPVIFAALTTMIFFLPMMFVPGETRQFTIAIPIVVILSLTFSLIESLLILPTHLRHGGEKKDKKGIITRIGDMLGINALIKKGQKWADGFLEVAISKYYRPFLDRALRNKSTTVASFVAALIIVTYGLMGSGFVGFVFQPPIPQDFVQAQYTFPDGTPFETSRKAVIALETAAQETIDEIEAKYPEEKIFKNTMGFGWRNNAMSFIVMEPSGRHDVNSEEVLKLWREKTPTFPDAKDVVFDNTFNESSDGMRIRLSSADREQIVAASEELKTHLNSYDSIYYVTDTADSAQSEAVLSLLPSAENLNLSLRDLGIQVRQAFYGEEVQRVPRGVDDVKVMVRMPEEDRDSFDSLNQLRIRSGEGTEVPFGSVAEVNYEPAYTSIYRTDRERTLTVKASIIEGREEEVQNIRQDLQENFLKDLEKKYPAVKFFFGGDAEDQEKFMNSVMSDLLKGIAVIYVLFAIAFRSYFKPFIIMTALPFGLMGAVLGHFFLGMNLSIYSIMGILAAFGVVINDNLVLVDYICQLREKGYKVMQAVEIAAEERFRPIFLTSFTTFIGLIPLMLETSVQAQFLIPTVVSLAFGVLFATTVTLVLVPTLYVGMAGVRDFFSGRRNKEEPKPELTPLKGEAANAEVLAEAGE